MLHRIFTGLVLAALIGWAMKTLGFSNGVAVLIAAIPLFSALLNLLTGPVFITSAIALLGTVALTSLLDDGAKTQAIALFREVAAIGDARGPRSQ